MLSNAQIFFGGMFATVIIFVAIYVFREIFNMWLLFSGLKKSYKRRSAAHRRYNESRN